MLGSTLILMWFIYTLILVLMAFSYVMFGLNSHRRWLELSPKARAFASRFYGHGFQGVGLLVVLFSVIAELVVINEPVMMRGYDNWPSYIVFTLGFNILVGIFGMIMILRGQKIAEKYLTKKDGSTKQKRDFFEALERLEDQSPPDKTGIKMTLDELIEYERID